MSKTVWSPEIPEKDGLYWFDAGFGNYTGYPLVLQMRNNYGHVFGQGGTEMPLSMVYKPGVNKKARHAPINKTNNWSNFKYTDKIGFNFSTKTVWLLETGTGHQYKAVGILNSWGDCLELIVIWEDRPSHGSISGERDHSPYNKYLFSPIDIPNMA